jgi:hypothetical protein
MLAGVFVNLYQVVVLPMAATDAQGVHQPRRVQTHLRQLATYFLLCDCDRAAVRWALRTARVTGLLWRLLAVEGSR